MSLVGVTFSSYLSQSCWAVWDHPFRERSVKREGGGSLRAGALVALILALVRQRTSVAEFPRESPWAESSPREGSYVEEVLADWI